MAFSAETGKVSRRSDGLDSAEIVVREDGVVVIRDIKVCEPNAESYRIAALQLIAELQRQRDRKAAQIIASGTTIDLTAQAVEPAKPTMEQVEGAQWWLDAAVLTLALLDGLFATTTPYLIVKSDNNIRRVRLEARHVGQCFPASELSAVWRVDDLRRLPGPAVSNWPVLRQSRHRM